MYYAGHAAYVDGEDILFPVDVEFELYNQVNEVAKSRGIAAVKLLNRPVDVVYLNDLLKPVDKIFEEQPSFNGVATIYSTSKYRMAFDYYAKAPDKNHSPFASAFAELAQNDEELFYLFLVFNEKGVNHDAGRTSAVN